MRQSWATSLILVLAIFGCKDSKESQEEAAAPSPDEAIEIPPSSENVIVSDDPDNIAAVKACGSSAVAKGHQVPGLVASNINLQIYSWSQTVNQYRSLRIVGNLKDSSWTRFNIFNPVNGLIALSIDSDELSADEQGDFEFWLVPFGGKTDGLVKPFNLPEGDNYTLLIHDTSIDGITFDVTSYDMDGKQTSCPQGARGYPAVISNFMSTFRESINAQGAVQFVGDEDQGYLQDPGVHSILGGLSFAEGREVFVMTVAMPSAAETKDFLACSFDHQSTLIQDCVSRSEMTANGMGQVNFVVSSANQLAEATVVDAGALYLEMPAANHGILLRQYGPATEFVGRFSLVAENQSAEPTVGAYYPTYKWCAIGDFQANGLACSDASVGL
ncbi:hypothetical protein [Pseudobacteriovorax antillogorgiicola]|uniref:Uncharacterized protein n=1 Tax=Pseudobacteriovorax antillogorgiicola TaxID=1513793 RepID=A0A1Y6CQ79_9BACT|nr:hypothetical protein [Pseudobacteriovorax antillogorgiicola]TCS46189.1 hypothetical protein EDD56_12590 [Pseudobacteriovorax antillogorgiicola]SMF70095.1 hypothetical protein SAMN06296036_12590 [Pseudobacteriovorax antillogorgiicola]